MDKFTDQYFTYRETPVDYDGVGNITRIKGRTLVWNQLVPSNQSSNTVNGITFTNNNGTWTLNGTATANASIYLLIASPGNKTGHKLLLKGCPQGGSQTTYRLFDGSGNNGTDLGNGVIYTVTATNGNYSVGIIVNNGVTVNNLVFRPQLFDLTQMFGSGSEPTSVSEFVSLFSSSYYPYDSGSLLSFMGSGIKTTGKNQFNKDTVVHGHYINGNDVSAQNTDLAHSDYISVLSNTVYCSNIQRTVGVNKIAFYDAGKNLISFGNYELSQWTTPSNCAYVRINMREENVDIVYFNIGTDTTYEEYKESITDLPVLTYFPSGMKSAGSVYDELTPSKAITRIGVADLGSFTWTMYSVSQGNLFRSPNLNAIGYALQYDSTNLLCAKYPTVKSSSRTDKSISVGSNNCVDIGDSSYSDANAFKNAMNGVLLYFELSTESEQDINTKMLYPIYADGTEQILPTSDTSPFFGDIEYYNGTEGETNIRKFWLINGENERWDLTEKEFKAFLNNPQGLGFRKTVESVRYGERQNKVSETYNFPQPQGELLFYDSFNSTRYDKYNRFIRFLMNQPITLYYMIPVSYISGIANIYTLDCEVTEVQKTESKTDNILRSSIVFNGMEFYKGDPITVNGTGTSYTLTNEGDFPVGFEITIEGILTDPYVTLSQDGELYGEAKFDSSTAFNSVYVNSNDGEQNVILEQGGAVIPNPLSYQDLSISNGSIYVTFVKLARGVSELSIGSESGTVSSVKIEFTPMYRSV